MKTQERLDKYSAIWLSVPAYHDLTSKTKSYQEVSQWNGKKMREMSRYLLGVVTQSLRGGNPAQRPIFHCPIECSQELLKFYMYVRYKSHDDVTLSYMEDALHRFRTFKDVFLLGRASKKAKAKANALRTELVKKRTVHKETNAESWMPFKMRREMNAWQDYISDKIAIAKAVDAESNVPRIHLCLIAPNRFVNRDPCNSILPRDMNKHIKRTSRMVGTPPITISTTCHK